MFLFISNCIYVMIKQAKGLSPFFTWTELSFSPDSDIFLHIHYVHEKTGSKSAANNFVNWLRIWMLKMLPCGCSNWDCAKPCISFTMTTLSQKHKKNKVTYIFFQKASQTGTCRAQTAQSLVTASPGQNRHGNIVKNKKGRSMVTALSNKEVVADTSNADMGDGFS